MRNAIRRRPQADTGTPNGRVCRAKILGVSIGTLAISALLAAAPGAQARVTKIVVDQAIALPDGQNESLSGRAFGELDPKDRLNAIITDIGLAPRNSRGRVEYVSKFTLTKPKDMAKASGVLWYDVVNRGRPVAANVSPSSLGPSATKPQDFGHVALISGWQGDILQTSDNWTVQVPVAHNPDGSSITGVVLARIANAPAGSSSRPLGMLATLIPYDAASLDTTKARLIAKRTETRAGEAGELRDVPPGDWAFADCSKTKFPGDSNPRSLCLRDGFDPGMLYELVYQARDPKVLGVGLATMRDVASFFRFEAADDEGTPNPVAGKIHHAVVQGISQSGNALKTFLLLGFNEDEQKRRVFDGANPHIAGRLTSINVRFGLPSGSGTLYEPGGEGTLWWASYTDKKRGRPRSSLLDRCSASETCPKIFETFGASEYNARLMTIAETGTDAKADLELPANVRRYFFPGTTHGGGAGGFTAAPRPAAGCVLAQNPNPEDETMNALQVSLVDWVVHGTEPPPSVYPTLAHGDLVANTHEAMNFPEIPGVPSPTGMAVGLMDYDFGETFDYANFSGVISRQPPAIRQIIPALMPRVDADGNETVGVRSVLHQVPLGTYLGWNATAAGFFKGQPCGGGLTGGYIPFAKSKAERLSSSDPRPSLEERYGTQAGYLCLVKRVAEQEVSKRFLRREDANRLMKEAAAVDYFVGIPDDRERDSLAEKLCRP
ncbi:alpha/beta hydrolase domain-containing protein [Bradyrhizobium sp. CCGB12]|uniref:alpha/beta hydrolase domain-containing protein n=1 Tax=Bradyrhizobium sp. CCGB12 TaxID=2949632 RepID=UPI0020B43F87|nr:alpha/beta hydrolase domain-containing protein [Bradyrhizobium sp. CCGB12]MCP3387834.1 alpha/beta hydrolase domain-containing protein [Bradyrhizobium sp. CCGB12]